jgi:hypothetical protein
MNQPAEKVTGFLSVPQELLDDAQEIGEQMRKVLSGEIQLPALPAVPRRLSLRERVARRVFRLIAGYDAPEEEEDW